MEGTYQGQQKKSLCYRPLYRAINKYGVSNFTFEILEETDSPIEREQYYIQQFGSFGSKGYNTTIGGDGTAYLTMSDQEVINKYQEVLRVTVTAEYFNCCVDTVRNILKRNNIEILSSSVNHPSCLKVFQYTPDGEFVQEYKSIADAKRALNSPNAHHTHISECARGLRKSAYGFHWRFELI